MTPKASSATKTSASNAWTSEHGPHFLVRRSLGVGGCSMKITEDVRKYAADQEALKRGMEEKAREFVEKGAEVYTKA